MELSASSYNLLFLCMQEKAGLLAGGRGDRFIRKQEEVLHYFLRHPQYIPFRWNANCYGVLVKADNEQMEELTDKALEHIRQVCGGRQPGGAVKPAFGLLQEGEPLLRISFYHAGPSPPDRGDACGLSYAAGRE